LIPPGTYTESLVIDKVVTLQGVEDNSVTIYASPGRDVLTLSSPHVVFRNLILEPGPSQSSYVINLRSGTAAFDQCTIKSNLLPALLTAREGFLYFTASVLESGESTLGYISEKVRVEFALCTLSAKLDVGIVTRGESHLRLRETKLVGCGDSGIVVEGKATLECYGSVIAENGGDAIELWTSSPNNVIQETTISDHANGAAIVAVGNGALTLTLSELKNCQGALLASKGFTVNSQRNTFEGPPLDSEDLPLPDVDDEEDKAEEDVKEALVAATESAHVRLDSDVISGECLIGIASASGSNVECTGVTVHGPITGASVTGARLTFQQSTFDHIASIGIEAHDDATLQVTECKFEAVDHIGLLLQNRVRGFIKDTEITKCGVGIHYVENAERFDFQQLSVSQCIQNGVNVKNTTVVFTGCKFVQCPADLKSEASGVEIHGDKVTKATFAECAFTRCLNGITAGEGADVVVDNSTFDENAVGVTVSAGKLELSKSKLRKHSEAAIFNEHGAKTTVKETELTASRNAGVFADGQGTTVALTKSSIRESNPGNGVRVTNQAAVTLSGCVLVANKKSNIDVLSGGTVVVDGGELSGSKDGIGVRVRDAGTKAKLSGAVLKQEKSAIVVEQGGDCTCQNCDVSLCEVCGISLQDGSLGLVTGNRVHDMHVGIQVDGGKATIQDNDIRKIELYGIFVAITAEPIVKRNRFTDVAGEDVRNGL
jgi:hypothetical protein